jgi:hypothetical protein
MNKEFIPYEQALTLKELGFNEPCFGVYGYNKLSKSVPDNLINKNVISYIQDIIKVEEFVLDFNDLRNCNIGDDVSAPTFSQAFKWFREKYNISYSIDWMSRSLEFYNGYYVHFRGINGNKINQENFIVLNDELPPKGYGVYKTYEEAELACLIKLIEIVKNK